MWVDVRKFTGFVEADALNLLLYFVHGPLKDPDGFSFPQSAMFGDASRLPALFEDGRLHIGLYFVLLALVASFTSSVYNPNIKQGD